MQTRKVLGLAVMGLGLGLVGCGDDGGGGDNGGLGLPVLAKGGGGAANLGCSPTAPDPGDSRSFTLAIEDFQSGDPVPGVCVNFYGDNMVPTSDSCGDTLTDADGLLQVTDPDGAWYAYRIFEGDTNVGVVQRNEAAPMEGGMSVGNSVSMSTAQTIPGVLLLSQDPADAIFAGTVTDCDGDPLEGAAMRVIQNGEVVPEGEGSFDAHYEYFNGDEFPQPDQEHTNVDGLFIGVNIPVETPGGQVQVAVCGKDGEGAASLIGCEETRSFANTVNIINVGPLRSDGPTCPEIDCAAMFD